jgi:hypothetical protein
LAGSDSRWALLRQFLEGKGKEASFYAVSDGKDNDGDGCVDEEVADGYDNDGDGLVDEDVRVGYRDSTSAFNGPGALALRTTQDAVAVSRLVGSDGVTGLPRVGRDPTAQDTAGLHYVTGDLWRRHPGLFARFAPYADELDSSYAVKHWKLRTEWTSATLDSLGVSSSLPLSDDSSDASGTRLSHAQLVDIRLAILGISDPARRIRAGRRLVGGCWNDVSLPADSLQ